MTNKLIFIINSHKVPKIKKILLYEMKFLVPNYSCLQNPWLEGYRPQIPVLSVLNWICWTPHPNKIPEYATDKGYLLTPWCRVLLEKLTGLQLVKKYGTRRFITALTSVRHLSLSWASPIQSTYTHLTSWRLTFTNSTLWSHGICLFCMALGTNSKFCLTQQ